MNGKGDTFSFGMNIDGIYTYLAFIQPLTIHSWAHMCYAMDFGGGKVDLAVNGRIIGKTTYVEGLQTNETISLTTIHLGSTAGGGHVSFIGNMNIYKAQQSKEQLKNLTTESCEAKGDILAWEDVELDITGHGSKQEVEIAILCWQLDQVVVSHKLVQSEQINNIKRNII